MTEERPVCLGSVEWADHDWQRTVRRGYVVRIYCSRCNAAPTDMLNRPVSVPPFSQRLDRLGERLLRVVNAVLRRLARAVR